jgi:hypothetical protein
MDYPNNNRQQNEVRGRIILALDSQAGQSSWRPKILSFKIIFFKVNLRLLLKGLSGEI